MMRSSSMWGIRQGSWNVGNSCVAGPYIPEETGIYLFWLVIEFYTLAGNHKANTVEADTSLPKLVVQVEVADSVAGRN